MRLIDATQISDSNSRKHVRDSAGSCARNLAEGAGRRSREDKRRIYGIAQGELCESIASVETDNALGGCPSEQLNTVYELGSRLNAMLTALTR